MGGLPPITASTFNVRSPENTSFANRASTLANPDLVISPTFVEANYEVLEALLRDHRRQVRNEELCTELDYYSEEGRVVEFKDAPNRDGSRVEKESDGRRPSEHRTKDGGSRGGNLAPLLVAHLGRSENEQPIQSTLTSGFGGNQPSTNSGGNLPPNGTYLSYNALPFIPNSLQPLTSGHMSIYVNPYSQHNANMTYGQPLGYYFIPKAIEDYPLPNELKMPYHVGSYNGKEDPDNYLHLFEGSIVNYEDLKEVPTTLQPTKKVHEDTFGSTSKGMRRALELSSLDTQTILSRLSGCTMSNTFLVFSWAKDKKPCGIPLYGPPYHLQGSDEEDLYLD
ncbi:hypothetical protein Tco_0295009 [Tanacetum coccineum]